MKATKQELLEQFRNIVPDVTTDDAIAFIENMNDSFTDENSDEINRLNEKISELENEKADIDKTWRERYINRFFGGPIEDDEFIETKPEIVETVLESEEITADDLFTEKEGY